MVVPVTGADTEAQMERIKSIVLNEVNVKEIEYLYDTSGLIVKKAKPNFKTLGKKYGKQMKEIADAMLHFSQEEIGLLERSDCFRLTLTSSEVMLTPEDVSITSEDMPGWLVAVDGGLTVALDITISDALRCEGIARELVNRIQNLRKESGFEVTDKIEVRVEAQEDVIEALASCKTYICAQTLACDIETIPLLPNAKRVEWGEDTLGLEVIKK